MYIQYTHIYIYTYTYIYIHIYIHTHTWVCIFVCSMCMCTTLQQFPAIGDFALCGSREKKREPLRCTTESLTMLTHL